LLKDKKNTKNSPFFSREKINIDNMLVSGANRAVQTAEIIANVLRIPKSGVQFENNLYLASADDMLNIIFGLDEKYDHIMLVGHNPGISDLAAYLSKENIDWMLTSAVISIESNTTKWYQISTAENKLKFHIKPADI
jgi:phosphohistidine phosphatase